MKEYFYVITMKTKNGKTIYLGEQGNKLGWSFDYDEAIWFETLEDSENFARDYFKYFKNWEIKEIYIVF
jgi:hypothetical protein